MLNAGKAVGVTTVAISLVLAWATAAGAKPSEAFSKRAVVKSLDVSCVTGGALKERVVVDTRVRYGDARSATRFAGGSHTVSSSLGLRSVGGSLLARDLDRGTAQVDIPEIKGYVHAHRHVLSRTESRAVLGDARCGDGSPPVVRATVRVRQTLAAGKRRAVASAPTSQTAADATTESVDPIANPGTAINGCLVAGSDFNCHGVDLSGRNLSSIPIAFGDFSWANLKNANLQGERMGHVIMNKTILDGANMRGAQFGIASLTSASLVGTDLTGAVGIYSNLAFAHFSGAKLENVDLQGANLVGTVFENSTCDANTKFPTAFSHGCVGGLITPG
jgi:hypothetical protein